MLNIASWAMAQVVRRPIPQSRSYVKYARDSPLCKGAMMKRSELHTVGLTVHRGEARLP